MRPLHGDPWWRRWLDRLCWRLLQGARLRSGPVMFEACGAFYYLTPSGTLYRLVPDWDWITWEVVVRR